MSKRLTLPGAAAISTLAIAASLATASDSAAQALSTAEPERAGRVPTQVHWEVDGTQAPVSRRIPSSFVMRAPGFRLDRRAAAKRCNDTRAALDECPAKSRIGSGLMKILVHRPIGPNELPIEITLYRGAKEEIVAIAFLAGPRIVPGTLERRDGDVVLTFDPLPVPPVIDQVSYEFLGVSVDLGVTRKATKKVRRNGRTVRRTVRYSLLRTPRRCTDGAWPGSFTIAFPDGSSEALSAPIACQGGQ